MSQNKEIHLYKEIYPKLVYKGFHTVPKNGSWEDIISTDDPNSEYFEFPRIIDIFWEASELDALSFSKKGPNPSTSKYDTLWEIAFHNNSNKNIDIKIYTLESIATGIIEVEKIDSLYEDT